MLPLIRSALAVTLATSLPAVAFTQATPATPATAAPRPADVESIDGIISALYQSISGAAGVDRQWDRFRSLMAPGARLIPTRRMPDSSWTNHVMTPEEYITANDAGLKRGFFEKEIARKMDRFGNIVQLFSTYESRRVESDPPIARGINSIQLHFDGKRWWILSIFWEAESPLHPLPPEYLPKKDG